MQVIFERGDRGAPVGHALIYFRADTGAILATYVSVPPIPFDLTKFMPPFLSGAMAGMDLGNAMVATPIPPIPEEVDSVEYLQALAARRQDDLIYAGGAMGGDPMRLAQETAEAAQTYGALYQESLTIQPSPIHASPVAEPNRFADLTEREQLDELTALTGRLRDSLQRGGPDPEIERQMRQLAALLPTKYRAPALVEAARTPGQQGQKLAALYLERSYKLYNEDYLDLERIDREIEAIGD